MAVEWQSHPHPVALHVYIHHHGRGKSKAGCIRVLLPDCLPCIVADICPIRFRDWNNPGVFAESRSTGALGRWEGYLAAIWNVSFCVVGPEYISLIAAEAKHPRTYMKAAYKTVYYRFGLFFIGSGITVGIVLPYNDPTLVSILRGSASGAGTAAASPYVIAMKNLGITVFPHIVNFLLCTSIFSAGNTYVYCATRSLYSLALEDRAPNSCKNALRTVSPFTVSSLSCALPCSAFFRSEEVALAPSAFS